MEIDVIRRLNELLDSERYGEVARVLESQIRTARSSEEREKAYDFVGTMATIGWGGAVNEFIRTYKGIRAEDGYEIDRYILNKYCMLPGERIGPSFVANVRIENLFFKKARVHFSGERVVIVAEMEAKSSGTGFAIGGIGGAIGGKIAAYESFGHVIPKLYELGAKLGRNVYGIHLPFEGCTFKQYFSWWQYRHRDVSFVVELQPIKGRGEHGVSRRMARDSVENALIEIRAMRKSFVPTLPAEVEPAQQASFNAPEGHHLSSGDGTETCLACGGEVSSGMCFSCGAKVCPACHHPNEDPGAARCERCQKPL